MVLWRTDASRGTYSKPSPRSLVVAPPVHEGRSEIPATKAELQWFQAREKKWRQSPRGGKIAPLGVPSLPPSSASSTADKSPLRPTSAQPVPVLSLSQKSPLSSVKVQPDVESAESSTPPQPVSSTFALPTFRFPSNENAPKSSTFKPSPVASSPFKVESSFKPPQTVSSASPFGPAAVSSSPFAAAPVKEPSKEDPSNNNHRERLIQFYKKYNPSKVDTVDSTLANYKGKEELLFRKLEEKYVSGKDGMLPPTGTGPRCFMDFSVDGTAMGRVVIQLFQDKAPLACENFRCLCTGEKGKGRSTKDLTYRHSKIHRLVPGMCIQGGDFTKGDGTGGESIYPPNSTHGDMWGKFVDETPFLMHTKKGLLSMANNGPNRNGSQFFFTLKPLPYLDGKHVVFGEVVTGMEVLEEINKLESDKKQRPIKTLMIEDCGELKDDGKEIRSPSEAKGPPQQSGSTFGAFGFAPAKQPSPFSGASASSAQGSSNPFGSFSSSAQSSSNPFASFSSKTAASGSGSAFSFGVDAQPKAVVADTTTKTPFGFPAAAAPPSQPTGGAFSSGQGSSASTEPVKSAFSGTALEETKAIDSKSPAFSFGGLSSAGGGLAKTTGAVMKIWEAPASSFAATTESSKPSTTFGQAAGAAAGSIFGAAAASASFSFGSGPGQLTSGAPQQPAAETEGAFSFGKPEAKPDRPKPASTTTSATAPQPVFSFGIPTDQAPTSTTTSTTSSQPAFSFGKAADKSSTATTPSAPQSAFSFGKPGDHPNISSSVAPKPTSTAETPKFSFGMPPDEPSFGKLPEELPKPSWSKPSSSPAPAFSFGKPAESTPADQVSPKLAVPAVVSSKTPFALGKPSEYISVSPKKEVPPTTTSEHTTIAAKSAFTLSDPDAVAEKDAAMPDKAFSFGEAPGQRDAPDMKSGVASTNSPSPAFSFGKPDVTSTIQSATPAFSFGKPDVSSTTQSATPAFSFGKPSVSSALAPAPSAFAFKPPQSETPKPATRVASGTDGKPPQAPSSTTEGSRAAKSPFTIPKAVPQTAPAKPASRRTPSPAKPLLPSFYFGEDKSVPVEDVTPKKPVSAAAGPSSSIDTSGAATQGAIINLDKKLATAEDDKDIDTGSKDVSFASFSPSFIKPKQPRTPPTSTFKGFATPTEKVPVSIMKAVGGSREGVSRAHISPTKKGAWSASPTPVKPKKMSTSPKSAKKGVLGGVVPGVTYSPGGRETKRAREVEEAVADILAERVFFDDELLSKVSVQQVERLMAAALERKIEVLEHIDVIESSGKTFTWDDIEFVLQNGRTPKQSPSFSPAPAAKKSVEPGVGSSSPSRSGSAGKSSATLEVWNDVDRARTSAELEEWEQVGTKSSEVEAGSEDVITASPDSSDSELLLVNLETLN